MGKKRRNIFFFSGEKNKKAQSLLIGGKTNQHLDVYQSLSILNAQFVKPLTSKLLPKQPIQIQLKLDSNVKKETQYRQAIRN